MDVDGLIKKFYTEGIIKFGSYTLKDGRESCYYIDLRMLISHPFLLIKTGELLSELICDAGLKYDRIAGVPLTGIIISTMVITELGAPGLLLRKYAKGYGCNNMIEGSYIKGDRVLLVDDVITSATSKYEAIRVLNDHGLSCNDVVVIVDRQDTPNTNLSIHALMTIDDIVRCLLNWDVTSSEDKKWLSKIERHKICEN